MFLVWIAGAWLGANVAVVALLVALSERGRRRHSALPPTTAVSDRSPRILYDARRAMRLALNRPRADGLYQLVEPRSWR
jgi:hypothetical protein